MSELNIETCDKIKCNERYALLWEKLARMYCTIHDIKMNVLFLIFICNRKWNEHNLCFGLETHWPESTISHLVLRIKIENWVLRTINLNLINLSGWKQHYQINWLTKKQHSTSKNNLFNSDIKLISCSCFPFNFCISCSLYDRWHLRLIVSIEVLDLLSTKTIWNRSLIDLKLKKR